MRTTMTTLDTFQSRVAAWCVACFGKKTAEDRGERNWRFLEESMELVQSLGGTAEEAHSLVDYVFNREPGAPKQELGGAVITLAALAAANGLSLHEGAMAELERIERPDIMEAIRKKHVGKQHRSHLPDDFRHPDSQG